MNTETLHFLIGIRRRINWIIFFFCLIIFDIICIISTFSEEAWMEFYIFLGLFFILSFVMRLYIKRTYPYRKEYFARMDDLRTYIQKQVSPDWLSTYGFRELKIASYLMIKERDYQIKLGDSVSGSYSNAKYTLQHATLLITRGRRNYVYFNGYVLAIQPSSKLNHFLHIRSKRLFNPNLSKRLGNFKVVEHNRLLIYKSLNLDERILNTCIDLHQKAKEIFHRKVYLTLTNQTIYIGINHYKDYLKIGFFSSFTIKSIDRRINKLKNLNEKIEQLCSSLD